MKRIHVFLVVVSFPLYFIHARPEKEFSENLTQWKAGVAKMIITPDELIWMGAYVSRNRPAKETRHDLWAKVLVLEDAKGNRAVMVSSDLVGIRNGLSDRVRKRIKERYGHTHAQVLLNSSHTHTALETENKFHNLLLFTLNKAELVQIDRDGEKLEKQLIVLVGKA
ncbi:MAG: hypothetical protein WD431_02495 [Cyclobacteriaceae bacterium]